MKATKREFWGGKEPEWPKIPARVDYLRLEAANSSLGNAGEEFVLRFEVARLLAASLDRLATRVEGVSETHGDSAGYDILSYKESGKERLIEVKTTRYGSQTPFYVTLNELNVSRKEPEIYYLYRIFDFKRRPKLFHEIGSLDRSFRVNAVQFLAGLQ